MNVRSGLGRILIRIIIAAYFIIGLTLILQPDKYASTPSYANLIYILPSWLWGVIYLITVVFLIFSQLFVTPLYIGVTAHTVAIALTTVWFLAFVVRYFTDEGTTIVNVVSWGVFLTMLIVSAARLVDDKVTVEAVLKIVNTREVPNE
jgi:hypothetical protein